MLAAQRAAGPVSATEQKAIDQAIETGVALHRKGLLDDAERLYSGILKLAPRHFDAMHLLGVLCNQRGETNKALELMRAALELNGASADAHSNYGKLLLQLRRYDEALVSIERALTLSPDQPQALINRATIRIEQRRFAEAMTDALRVLEKDPQNVDGWTKRGYVLAEAQEFQQAIACYEKALSINPDHLEAVNNRGCLLGDIGRTEQALEAYEHVLTLDPRHVEGWINRGHMLVELHREAEGMASYEHALTLAPHQPDALFNLGVNELRLGRFRLGWDKLELRWFTKDFLHTQRKYPLPRWGGETLDGPLLVSGEQGLGDQILYASMLADVTARTPEVTVEIEPRLIPLFARSFPRLKLVAREAQLYDGHAVAQIPIASLGRLLRPDLASFPRFADGYLRCNEELSTRLRQRLDDGRKVIGVSWNSRNPRYEMSKSARLHDFAPLFRSPGCRFIDLQYGDTQADRDAVAQDLGATVEHLDDVDNTNDLDALASLIKACDLVVTVSNTTAHLAGALGKETYVLVPSGRGRMWFWFKESPFYPRVHAVQQKPKQPWVELVAGIASKMTSEK